MLVRRPYMQRNKCGMLLLLSISVASNYIALANIYFLYSSFLVQIHTK